MTPQRMSQLLADPKIHAVMWGRLPGSGGQVGWLCRGAVSTTPVTGFAPAGLLPLATAKRRRRRVTVGGRAVRFVPVEGIEAYTWVAAGAATPWTTAGSPSTAERGTITAVARATDGGTWLLLAGHCSLPVRPSSPPLLSWRRGAQPPTSGVSEGADVAELLGAEVNGVVDVGWARAAAAGDQVHPVAKAPPPFRTASPPAIDTAVWIQSRMTPGLRKGKVVAGPHPETGLSAVEVTVAGSTVIYSGAFAIEGEGGPFSRRGDSGSLVFVADAGGLRACGTIVAGDRDGSPGEWSYALPVRPTLSVLGQEVYNLFFSDNG